jgi:peptidyl-prolyl cis-trans isomerase A (cyclophilin A)
MRIGCEMTRRAFIAAAALLLMTPVVAGAQKPKEGGLVYVKMATTLGDITLELNREKAPISTDNFLKYVDKKFYDGTIFHRVIPDFMIQGGGFTPEMNQKSGEPPIKNEWQNGLKNVRGSIAMARTSDPDSATSQFFINLKDNGFLDQPRGGAAYAVFGKVVEGMDTVDKIKAVATTTKAPYENVPETPVVIKSVRRLTPEEVKALKARLAKTEKK